MDIDKSKLQYFVSRKDWRKWLTNNYNSESEVWLVYPNKSTGKPRILYNDAVEEALCFGWIDSIIKKLDKEHSVQRFSPRRKRSKYSQPNKERIKWLAANNLIHESILPDVNDIINELFIFPDDITDTIKCNADAWNFFKDQSESYKRIRIAYIDSVRARKDEFNKRLANLINQSAKKMKVKGFGGIDKYY